MKAKVRKPTENEKEEAESWPIWEKEESEFPWEYSDQETCLYLGNQEKNQETLQVWLKQPASFLSVFFLSVFSSQSFSAYAQQRVY